jgi:hypothetical protein
MLAFLKACLFEPEDNDHLNAIVKHHAKRKLVTYCENLKTYLGKPLDCILLFLIRDTLQLIEFEMIQGEIDSYKFSDKIIFKLEDGQLTFDERG